MDKKSYDTQLVRLTQSLVNIETENRPPDGHEKEGQEYVKRYLLGLGMEVTAVSYTHLSAQFLWLQYWQPSFRPRCW